MDKRTVLSLMWVFVMLNYLYCDVMTLMDSVQLKQILAGAAGSIQISQGFLLGSAILMEIPIAMILLSRLLPFKGNKLANIIAGIIMTMVQIASLFVGKPSLYYLFFSTIEISCTLFIVWSAWQWRSRELNTVM